MSLELRLRVALFRLKCQPLHPEPESADPLASRNIPSQSDFVGPRGAP